MKALTNEDRESLAATNDAGCPMDAHFAKTCGWFLAVILSVVSPTAIEAQPLDSSNWQGGGYPPSPYDAAPPNFATQDLSASPEPISYHALDVALETDRVAALEQRINDLEKQVHANLPKKTAPGEWEDVSQEKWTVKLGGHVQVESINWAQASPAITGDTNYFEFRRLRLVADGKGYGVYDFRLQMTLEPESVGTNAPGVTTSPDIKDAYFSINELPWLGRLRIGNFFVPFSLEQVTNDTNNIFLERSIPSQGVFAVDREVGLAQYNCTDDESISWATGVFYDSISEGVKERIDDNQGYRVSGRLNWIPFYDEPSNGRYAIHTGVGVIYTDDQDNSVRFRSRPQIHEGPQLIDSGPLLANDYTTGNVEFAVINGPITLQSEAFVSNVNLTSGGSESVQGMYAHLSYFLTGENRIYERFGQHGAQFGRNAPYNNVFAVPGCRSWGAWEAKVRWSHLDLTSVDRGQYNDVTAGFNWYWSDRVRLMFDWIHPVTSSDAVFGAVNADIVGVRFDWNW